MRVEGLGNFEVVGYEGAEPVATDVSGGGVFWEGAGGSYVGAAGKGTSVLDVGKGK